MLDAVVFIFGIITPEGGQPMSPLSRSIGLRGGGTGDPCY